jgi:hypothetical protein
VSKQLPVKRGRQEGQLSSYHLQFTSHFYCLACTKVALARSAALSPTGQDHLGALQACRGSEQTLSVQRQAIEHLFEIDFGTESLLNINIPLPGARIP